MVVLLIEILLQVFSRVYMEMTATNGAVDFNKKMVHLIKSKIQWLIKSKEEG